jgi:hypothetical protein
MLGVPPWRTARDSSTDARAAPVPGSAKDGSAKDGSAKDTGETVSDGQGSATGSAKAAGGAAALGVAAAGAAVASSRTAPKEETGPSEQKTVPGAPSPAKRSGAPSTRPEARASALTEPDTVRTRTPAVRRPGAPTAPDKARTGPRTAGGRVTESPRLGSAPAAAPPGTEPKSGRVAGAAAGAVAAGAGAAAAKSAAPAAAPEEKTAGPKAPREADPARTGSQEHPKTGSPGPGSAATAGGGAAAAVSAASPAEPAAAERTDAIVPVADPQTDPDADAETPPRPGIVRDRRRRRRVLFSFVLAAAILAAFLGLVALVSDHGSSTPPRSAPPEPAISVPLAPPAPPPPPQLPRGGTTFFPNHRVVAYYGTADTDRLGVLGAGTPEQAAEKLERAAAPFAGPGRTVQPAMELIVGVADGSPGPDGDYHHDIDQGAAQRYLATARAHKQMMIIDIQPGRSDFMTAVKPWENLLREPDVSLALDPEWRMPPGEVPGKQIGTVSADEVNQVSTWLAGMVKADNLPQKLFVVHQFTPNEIANPERLQTPPELAVVQHIDGFGAPPNKLGKYQELQRPQQLHLGFKLFYTQDTPMLTAAQALALQPAPDLVTYQ